MFSHRWNLTRRAALSRLAALLATSRGSLSSKDGPPPRQTFNVRHYGASGTGRVDDTAAIQRTIDAAQAAGGGRVIVPAGQYMLSSAGGHCLRITGSGISLSGDGYSSLFFCRERTRVASLLCIEPQAPRTQQIQGIVIESLRFDGRRSAQRGEYQMKNVVVNVSDETDAPAKILLRALWSHDAYSGVLPDEGGGISLEGSDHLLGATSADRHLFTQAISVVDCFAYDNDGWGIGTNWSAGVRIHGNVTWSNATMGITCWNSQRVIVSSNVSYANRACALNIEASEDVTITGNDAVGDQVAAISVYNSRDVLLASNRAHLSSDYWEAHTVRILSGPGYGPAAQSFKQRASENVTLVGNVVSKAGKGGFAVHVAGPDARTPLQKQGTITVNGNDISNTGNPEKALFASAVDLRILNSQIRGGLQLDGESIIAHGNTVEIDSSLPIDAVRISSKSMAQFSHNTVLTAHALHSVCRLVGSAPNLFEVSNNTFTGESEHFVFVDEPNVTAIVRANILSASTGHVVNHNSVPPVAGSWRIGTVLEIATDTGADLQQAVCIESGRPGKWQLTTRSLPFSITTLQDSTVAEPSVAGASILHVPDAVGSSKVIITGLRDGTDGQAVTILFDTTATIRNGDKMRLNGGRDLTGQQGDTLMLVTFAGRWYETGRSLNRRSQT